MKAIILIITILFVSCTSTKIYYEDVKVFEDYYDKANIDKIRRIKDTLILDLNSDRINATSISIMTDNFYIFETNKETVSREISIVKLIVFLDKKKLYEQTFKSKNRNRSR